MHRHPKHSFWLVLAALSLTGAGERPAPPDSPIAVEPILRPKDILRAYVARIDLTDPAVHLRVVPAGGGGIRKGPWPTTLATVSTAAEREGFALAINGDFFAAEQTADAEGPLARSKYVAGKPALPLGNTVTDGNQWTRRSGTKPVPMLLVAKDGSVSIASAVKVPKDTAQALSGNLLLVADGQPQIPHREEDLRAPRTALGLTADRKTLILLVVDGRSFTSRGQTLGELAAEMARLGAHTALNLDGGGSSAMVLRNQVGELHLQNHPSDGAERPVANVFGITLTPK